MRHKHNLSHYKLLTGDMGNLYPIGLVEVLPADAFQHSTSCFMRFSPMAAPVMHPVTVRIHHMFVPHRLTWPESEGGGWENFITGGENNDDTQVPPQINTTGTEGDLLDYFNLPVVSGISVSALPVRAFNLCFNEFYRDQDLVTARAADDVTIPKVAWEKDYLTTARPFAQKGPAITLPIGGEIPIIPTGDGIPLFRVGGSGPTSLQGDGVSPDATWSITPSAGPAEWEESRLIADLGQATAIDIIEFRKAFALQRFAEARAKFGSRYTEYLRYLGATPADARLQRPEYLGGGKTRVSISEVLQTAEDQ